MPPGSPRQIRAWLGVALLAVAACSSDGDDLESTARSTTSVEDSSDPGDGPTPPPGTDVPAEDAPADSGPGGSAPSQDGPTRPTSGVSGPDAPSAEPAPAPGGVGAFARFYLQPAESTSVLVDIRSQSGAEPSPATVDHLRRVLAQVSGKQVQVGGGGLEGAAREWSADDLRTLADSSGVDQSRDRSVIRLLFLRGGFAGDENVLGAAVRSDVAAVFSDRVDEAAGPVGNRGRIEDAITVHEVGHLLGLVDLVLDRGRADPDHPGHSPNRSSVMYYAVESTLVGSILTGGPPTEFDADDLADLAAIRGG